MDYGAAVSQKGYDVNTCGDRFLVYSSAFQTLKIYNIYSVSGTVAGSDITITHNLGYYAPFIVIYNGDGNDKAYFHCNSRGYGFTNNISAIVKQTTTQLTITLDSGFDWLDDGTTVYFTVYIFLDDFRTVEERSINTSTTSGESSSDFGIRISKEGYDVNSCSDYDCVLSSGFFNNIIHKKGTVETVGAEATITHSLGYAPFILVYYIAEGTSYLNFIPPYSIITDEEITVYTPDSGDGVIYYIIFKNRTDG